MTDQFNDVLKHHKTCMDSVKLLHAGLRPVDNPLEEKECPCCKLKKPDVSKRRKNTAYADDTLNWLESCAECFEESVEYFQDRWDDYWSSVL